jgi:hypothetical protein
VKFVKILFVNKLENIKIVFRVTGGWLFLEPMPITSFKQKLKPKNTTK